ncbi:SET domain [Trypanosoma vivax]|uniref:Uncharacterized protein n=1 Tax=Trypanosoma vivax (strain Y486) TaxID=1055687 RepID=G0U346_TRYVY|nr:hypothetical protein TRVL_05203 [Trypanosoma vivax]KAH8604147.1 SET domain [Trypanosoma vivax]CCC50701.1 conserved hypothetical protein [Trypanosoma vivax Y486]
MSARVAKCDPRLLDFVTWAVVRGSRLFHRVHVTTHGLTATRKIHAYDFVAIVPTSATLSVLNVSEEPSFPLKVSPTNHGEVLHFWGDLSLGSFAFVGFLAKVLLSGQPQGLRGYLDVLPVDLTTPMSRVAEEGQRTDGYKKMVASLKHYCKVGDADFDAAFRYSYCLFRRHGIPFWSFSATGDCEGGHPDFRHSPFVKFGRGDIIGLVPILDLASHSVDPNAAIGYPDSEMLQWLVQEKKASIQSNKGYFVMQALRDIHEGERVTVNKNAYFNFDDEAFESWFGFPKVAPGECVPKDAAQSAVIDADCLIEP